MALSTHQILVPTVVRALHNLRHVLQTGQAHAREKGIADDALLKSRLIEDMLPLVRNVQMATDSAKNGIARVAGVESLKFEDDETTFEQLYARIDRAIDYIGTFTPEQVDAGEARTITLSTRSGGDRHFEGVAYLSDFMLPNFFFHCTTSYAILRKAGVPLGKTDFLWPK